MLSELAGELGISGAMRLRIGTAADYRQLARFHYTPAGPASFALTLAIDHITGLCSRRVIAVGVLSNPALNCRTREAALQLGRVPKEWRWQYLNRHLRTISRVIVHPQYRGIGLSSAVVRSLLRQAPTRYVESISRLAAHHPLFERAGMSPLVRGEGGAAAYYLLDRLGSCGRPNGGIFGETSYGADYK